MFEKKEKAMENTQACEQIGGLRSEIDTCDETIAHLLAQRFGVVTKIGEIKRECGLPIYDPNRESSQHTKFINFARRNNVPSEQVLVPFLTIISLSKHAQGKHETDHKPIVPKFCICCKWRTCGIEMPQSCIRVCPACRTPLF